MLSLSTMAQNKNNQVEYMLMENISPRCLVTDKFTELDSIPAATQIAKVKVQRNVCNKLDGSLERRLYMHFGLLLTGL